VFSVLDVLQLVLVALVVLALERLRRAVRSVAHAIAAGVSQAQNAAQQSAFTPYRRLTSRMQDLTDGEEETTRQEEGGREEAG
jgi:Sec-independent protein translocase protein TatA